MAECIYREEALSELYLLMAEHEDDQFEGKLLHWTGIKAILERLPAADVVERKTGTWLMDKMTRTCSVCGQMKATRHKDNFCPNCGAQMIGGDDDV